MKIVVGSDSKVKLDAVIKAVGGKAEVVGVKVPSGVPEQPEGDETLRGTRNRAAGARSSHPEAEFSIGIENGLFEGNIDKAAVVVLTRDGQEYIAYSKGVKFPEECVEQARELGFGQITVGKLMAQQGVVTTSYDPHAELDKKIPRAELLQAAVSTALNNALGWARDTGNNLPLKREL